APVQPELPNLRAAPVVVATIADHELDEVLRAQARELPVEIARLLFRPGSLHVDDPHYPLVNSLQRHRTARLERHAPAGITELSEEEKAAFLRERLATRYADIAAAQLAHLLHHGLDLPPLAAVEGVLGIAILTPQRTSGEAYENRGNPGG